MPRFTHTRQNLNGAWDFQPIHTKETELPHPTNAWDDTPFIVPSPWNGNAWGGWTNPRDPDSTFRCDGIYYPDYPEEWIHARMGWLHRTFTFTRTVGKRVLLHFDAVAGCAEIYVNGIRVGEHFDNWLPFEFDVTDVLLCAGDADWSQFNNVPEKVKCGAAFLHERVIKPEGAALVRLNDGCYAAAILTEPTESHFRFWRKYKSFGRALSKVGSKLYTCDTPHETYSLNMKQGCCILDFFLSATAPFCILLAHSA